MIAEGKCVQVSGAVYSLYEEGEPESFREVPQRSWLAEGRSKLEAILKLLAPTDLYLRRQEEFQKKRPIQLVVVLRNPARYQQMLDE